MVVALRFDFIFKLLFQVNDLKTQIRGIINDNEEMKLNQVKAKFNQFSFWDDWNLKSMRGFLENQSSIIYTLLE